MLSIRRAAPAWMFLLGYLAVWDLFGGGYLLSLVLLDVGMTAPGLRASNPPGRDRISAGVMAEVLRGGRAVRSIAI